jgi:hypothetical protein
VPHAEITDIPEVMKGSIVLYNGALTKNYSYISQLRKLDELQKLEEKEILEMRSKPKGKGLKRTMSFTSLCISGHIFDTRFFNDTLDILEGAKANFVIQNMKIGQSEADDSVATLQIFSTDIMRFNTALDKIYELAEGLPVEISKNYDEKPGDGDL